ncbi:uncharacterized protein LOC144178568 [Haemaphysalis longicornis]
MAPIVVVLALVFCVSWSDALCPSTEGVFSDCAFSSCTSDECAANGLECCPKPCGGTWCIEGLPELRQATTPVPQCPLLPPPAEGCEVRGNGVTCEQLHCENTGSVCCLTACNTPYCLPA